MDILGDRRFFVYAPVMDYLKINEALWDARTPIHYRSDFYDVEAFIAGRDSLNTIEIELLGAIRNLSVLHLQCHFGMDTLSLARRGARATGIDLSGKAIAAARQLSAETGVDVRFIESDVYSLPEKLDETFDVVFTSYGVVSWLPDMTRWADVVQRYLSPGGRFVMVEFHPVLWMFSDDFKRVEYKYSSEDPIVEEERRTYTDRRAAFTHQSVSWNHGLAEVIDALVKAGLVIRDLKEYDYSPYNCFVTATEQEPGRFRIEGLEGKLPMLYSVVATK